jgi:hypothetical protein
MSRDFTAVPTPIAPSWANREAMRRMPPMLHALMGTRHYEDCRLRAAAIAEKHAVLDLIEHAEGRA